MKIQYLSIFFYIAAIGCNTSTTPEELCVRMNKLLEEGLNLSQVQDASGVDLRPELNRDMSTRCVADYTQLRAEKPRIYKCISACFMSSKDAYAAMKCKQGCN